MATNKDSFNQLISRVKHDNSQKISVRYNILNKENSDISHNDHITENDSTKESIKDNQKTDFLPLNFTNCIEDSDSNTSCPLQTYSRENPMDFLTIELNSSSNDSTDQCASNHDISNRLCKTNPDSFNSIVKGENIKEKLSFESLLIHEEITFNNLSRQCDVLENETDIDIKRKVPEHINIETENGEQTKLFTKSKSDTKYSSDKCVAYSEPRYNRLQKELRNEDSVTEDIEYFVDDSDNIDIQDNYGK